MKNELIKRWQAPTPKFWKKWQKRFLSIASIGAVIKAPAMLGVGDMVEFPAFVTASAPYLFTIGLVGVLIAKLTAEDANNL